jgi:spermidine/putrescine-binding protein
MNIDLTKMNNLAKVEERAAKQILILCRATKAQGKVTGNFHYTPTSTTRNYYDEEIIDRDGPLSFTNLETSMRKYFQKRC